MSDFLMSDGIFSNGFGFSPKLVMRDKSLSIEAKAIYAYLASYAGSGMVAFPSVSLICADLNISERRFSKYRNQLVERGYITIKRERQESGFSNNIYNLNIVVPSQFVSLQNVSIQNVSLQNDSTNNNNSKSNNIKSNSSNNLVPSSDGTTKRYSDQFEAWWAIYPRKIGKGKAYGVWKKDKLDQRVDELINKLQQQVEYQYKFTEDEFIPHATTYLNGCRYDDEVEYKGVQNERRIKNGNAGRIQELYESAIDAFSKVDPEDFDEPL